MISQTAQYALRALLYISEHGGEKPVLAREISQETNVPKQYLSSILREAVRVGVLKSTRGKGGGFRLARPQNRIHLVDILAPFDDVVGRASCPMGQARCNDDNPCIFHNHWKPVSTAYRRMLEKTTLADVKPDRSQKRKRNPRK